MLPVVPAAIGFTVEQRLWLAGAWVALFLLPALWVRARAKRDGEPWGKWFALTLVASVLGVVEYVEHRSVRARREKRAEAARARGEAPPTYLDDLRRPGE